MIELAFDNCSGLYDNSEKFLVNLQIEDSYGLESNDNII